MQQRSTAILAAAVCAALSACGPQEQVVRPQHENAAAPAAGVSISNVVVRPGAAGGITAAYLTIHAGGEDRLLSVTSTEAERVELHETRTQPDGLTSMQPLPEGAPVGAAAPLVLQPGGAHLMVFNLTRDLPEGSTLPLQLRFEKAGVVAVTAAVGQPQVPGAASAPADAAHQHGH